jgi:hypothetical protein
MNPYEYQVQEVKRNISIMLRSPRTKDKKDIKSLSAKKTHYFPRSHNLADSRFLQRNNGSKKTWK